MHPTRPSHRSGRTPARRGRRGPLPAALALITALAATALLAVPSLASADSSSTLTVVGTSDVSDSGLIQNVIQPAFNAAYPGITFKYIGTATGTAITDAETGSVGASALIVHAASLENQFVAGGYSDERYGRALWTNDFVLAGPGADPAGVGANAPHNVAQAFADVAAAGIAGKAHFVSRGGTPGTTVEEHQLWALVAANNLEPSGLVLCAVNSANGGGDTPVAAGAGVANGQACPNGGALPTGSALPAWYSATGLTQGPNVVAANACTGYASGANSCYVLTDRGTYDYLQSGTDPAGSVPSLTVLTSDEATSAPGGQYGLVNYFHGYVINPSKPGETVNVTAAQDFLNLITSPTVQAAVGRYLATASGGAPFTPDASPLISTSRGLPARYTASRKLTLTGTVANAQPGFPAPGRVQVSVNRVVGSVSVPVASARTDATGKFTISFTPAASGRYTLSTPQVSQVENATLSPVFGDILSPALTAAKFVKVTGSSSRLSARSLGGHALVLGAVSPSTGHVKATVTVDARRLGSKGAYRKVAANRLASTDGRFAVEAKLAAGRWQLRETFTDAGTVSAARARTTVLTVRAGSSSRITPAGGSVSGSGRLTTHVHVSPRAVKGAKVTLLIAKLSGTGHAGTSIADTVSLKAGQTTATLRGRLKGAGRWAVLESYAVPGRATAWTSGVARVTIKAKSRK